MVKSEPFVNRSQNIVLMKQLLFIVGQLLCREDIRRSSLDYIDSEITLASGTTNLG